MQTVHQYRPKRTANYYRVRSAVRIVFWGLVVAAMAAGIQSCVERSLTYRCDHQTVIARAGDTAWGIAADHCTGNIEMAVDAIVDANGATIRIGQAVSLP